MIIYALYNLKGGVGKTTSCINLAYAAAKSGARTLVWDVDPQGAAGFYLKTSGGLNGEAKRIFDQKEKVADFIQSTPFENIDIIPANLKNRKMELLLDDLKGPKTQFKQLLSTLKNSYDYIFIDCPPTINLIAENVFRAAHFVLTPMIPTVLSERAYSELFTFFEKKDYDVRKLVPFFNLVDTRKKLHKDTIDAFQTSGKKLLKHSIGSSSEIERMGLMEAPIASYAPKSKAAYAYLDLWMEIKSMRKMKSRKLIEVGKRRF